MKLLIAGGGTGGHLFPGIAVAEELRARDPASEILFVGTARGIEARVVPKQGYALELIDASGLKTVGALGAVRGLFKIPRALAQSREILRRFRPDAVLGVGGYASGPVVLAARLAGLPTAILEQNSIPGLTNKILGRLVRAVFIAFEDSRRFFPSAKVKLAGNPIRRQLRARLVSASDRAAGNPVPHVFCFGGSQGAKAVNAIFAEAVKRLDPRPTIVHQTGKDDLEATKARYGDIAADVRDFIDDMASEYARADLVVARAGATTIAELTAIGRPAILIPYPSAADDHQTKNARELADAGAALVLAQASLTAEKLADAISGLLGDRARLADMSAAMKKLGRPYAAREVVDWLASPGRS